ncbi:protein IFH1-like isoform X2 [Pocillopora damicornis]|uniref:protein IFH1-like isoform X2 n=1 Tax=Pocillopora damicornis TaxID=46731 RepID=UPI000F552E3B|nr:protein IFH1-like isoform X2 [Pocillopora damicornis]
MCLDSSDSESSSSETDDSDSESDGSSDTDTDSDTEGENFCAIEKKPVRAKQKGASHKIPAKKKRTQPNKRKSSKENTGKGTSMETAKNKKGKVSKPRHSKKKVKQGKPNMKELEGLGRDIGDKWKILGRRLKVSEELEIIDARYNILSEKAFQMLKHWTQKRGSSATYRVLSGALKDELLERKDLSEKYCYG